MQNYVLMLIATMRPANAEENDCFKRWLDFMDNMGGPEAVFGNDSKKWADAVDSLSMVVFNSFFRPDSQYESRLLIATWLRDDGVCFQHHCGWLKNGLDHRKFTVIDDKEFAQEAER